MPSLGVFAVNMGTASYAEGAGRFARAAESAGFDSLWAGEHVVVPDPQVPPSPMGPTDRMLDPVACLSYLAAVTERVRLATGIIILPQRNPVVLAKELASLDVLSGGRFTFGVGVGYLEPEFRAIGAPFDDKGGRTLDHLAAMQALWSMEHPEYHGKYIDFAGVNAHPRPVQQPIPIVMGGHSPGAYRRSVMHGHGWYGFALDVGATAACLRGLEQAAGDHDRPDELGRLEISVTPRGRMDKALAEQFFELGVDRLVLIPRPASDIAALEDWVGEMAGLV